MTKRVAFWEFSVFQGVFPLASGYLQASACLDPAVKDAFEFEKHSMCVSGSGIEERLDQIDADVYAFSCYVWNMGLVKRLLPRLLARRPQAHVILGGPQVMNRPDRYLNPQYENLVLCNGEGEHTFAAYLEQLLSDQPDLSAVPGLSFFRDGDIITTEKRHRIRDLDSTPSPYLNGYLESNGEYVWAVIETNRGCPFKCTYCYWGAATNAKVHKYSLDRVLEELSWLSENRVLYVFIADANFGMLTRDVEIARHLADCKRKNGYPMTVYFSSSKNTPERVTEITRLFDEVGMVATQPISLQTMSGETLKHVKRSNIKTSSYIELQKVLNGRNLSSYVELIWPLPGETLESFKKGTGDLCRQGADSLIIYPLMLINNVEMNSQREEFQMVVIDDPDPNSEAQIVIGTKDVAYQDYLEGLRLSFHVTSLYTLRGLRFVGQFLDSNGIVSFEDLISSFSDFCKSNPESSYSQFVEDTLATSAQYKFSSMGGILHNVLHAARQEFDLLVWDFIQSQSYWENRNVRFLYELDVLNRPYVYRNTPITDVRDRLATIRVAAEEKDGYLLRMSPEHHQRAKDLLGFGNGSRNGDVRIRYRSSQLPFMQAKPLDDNHAYCNDKLHKLTSILPSWTVVA